MSDFATKLLPQVKKTLRQADDEFDDEIGSYIDTAATDLQNAGILSSFFQPVGSSWEPDSQILQACRWYSRTTLFTHICQYMTTWHLVLN